MVHIARWRLIMVSVVCLFGLWFALPNFFSKEQLERLPSFFPREQVNLGLDLQGGSSILLEVDLSNVESEHLASLVDETRRLFRKEKIGYTHLKITSGRLDIMLRKFDQADAAKSILRRLGGMGSDVTVEDNGTIFLTLSPESVRERKVMAVNQSIEIVRRRIDEMGTKEPSIQQQGQNRILVQLPGVEDPGEVKDLLGKTAKLAFRLVHPSVTAEQALKGRVPPGSELMNLDERHNRGYGHHKIVVQKKVEVSGEMLIDSQPIQDDMGGWAVSFMLDATGARRFADVTKKNIGRPFAIVLDGKAISAPVIQSEIPSGSGRITGTFTLKEARDLSILLRAGALPAPLTVLEERTVGPDLGADSIEAGKMATVLAIIMVLVFMFVIYGLVFGFAANVALVMNLVLLLAAITLLNATLTLPGIAGIALTLGMAVDANVLIYERIKEEIAGGQSILPAISLGYERAIGTIVDSNVTTLIGAGLLYIFGTGAVKGFAVTLSLGILISMFTAISLTRVFVLLWIKFRGVKSPASK
jgi:preprotein translocase subunit SecD